MTAGIASATGRTSRRRTGSIPNAIQTDAPINHGNSGGPLLDASGRVVGINDQIDTGGTVDGNVGVGFAIASNTAKVVVPELLARGHAAHGWLGVEVAAFRPAARESRARAPDHGVLVARVVPGSLGLPRPAWKAGTKQVTLNGESIVVGGDAILSVAGQASRRPLSWPT